MQVIGKARIKIDEFLHWRKNESQNWISDNWKDYFMQFRNDGDDSVLSYAEKGYSRFGSFLNAKPDFSFDEKVIKHHEYLQAMQMSWELLYYDDFLAVIRSAELAFALPVSMVEIEEYENLDNDTIGTLRKRITGPGTAPSGFVPDQAISLRQMKNRLKEAEEKITLQQEKLKSLEQEKQEELRRIREEVEQRYAEKMQELQKKQDEMYTAMERLKKELFLLDAEIYSIRCFLGEVIDFIPILSGTHAAEDTPVVLYQKLRYLDEEMGKYLAIYDFDARDTPLFEQALQHRKDLQDIFAPGPKSISLLRISRNAVQFGDHPRVANMLKEYETFHGKRIGILIRDGENIWMGWTDDDRISIPDENAFFEPKKKYSSLDSTAASSTKEEIASRYFVFSILQGLITQGKTLRLPKEASVFHENPYVIFSMADGWLEDNRFGMFSGIIDRTAQPLKIGDMVLTMMTITRDDKGFSTSNKMFEYLEPWNNNRGRGERNRTHDAYISNRKVYPVNLIEMEEQYAIICKSYETEKKPDMDNALKPAPATDRWREDFRIYFTVRNHMYHGINVKHMTSEDLLSFYVQEHPEEFYTPYLIPDPDKEIYRYDVPDHIEKKDCIFHYYLSAAKGDYGYSTNARANLEIMEDEYLNLTYLNSVYVLYAIQNRKIGGWRVGQHYLDYSNSLPYLQKALAFLKEREQEEAALLEKHMVLYPDWQVDLSEWRLQHGYHRLTNKRAEKFAAYIKGLSENR